jgi:DNA-binding response OmpR family regulator
MSQFALDATASVPMLNSMLLERTYGLIVIAVDVPADERASLVRRCRQFSQKSAILVVTEPVPVQERVQVLEAGADDVLMRPVHPDEFIARARALMRRSGGTVTTRIRVGNVEISEEGEVYLNGTRAELQQAEHKVLSVLVRRQGRLVSKAMIDQAVTGVATEELSQNAIEQRLSRLRKILEHANASVQITTVRGSGYILEPSRAAASMRPRIPVRVLEATTLKG